MDLTTFGGFQLVLILGQCLCTANSQQILFPGPRSKSKPCRSSFNTTGICAPLRQCGFLVNFLFRNPFKGRQVIHDSLCYPHQSNRMVCCPRFKKNSNKGVSKEKPHSSTRPPPIQSVTKDDSEDVNAYEFPLTQDKENPTQCGFSGKAFDRIVGGVSSTPGAWPWIANLGYLEKNKYEYLCGGSLISSQHVVTAAHCVHDQGNLEIVRLGEYDLNSDRDGAHPINVRIQKKVVHPHFNPRTMENDIAILKLDSTVKYTNEIHPICLPSANDFRNQDIEGTNPFVAGWGATHFRGSPSSVLKEIQVPVVDTGACKKSYERLKMATIDHRVICAGDILGGKDSCQGDSGGPLMAPQNSIFYLIGIVSNGYKCAEPGFPGVYTRVTSFLDFIQSNTH